jgi:hypothetical protein
VVLRAMPSVRVCRTDAFGRDAGGCST